jgi:hypothetical protein
MNALFVVQWVLACLLTVALAWVAGLGASRLRRLDRLHARGDAARGALLAALQRRADAALAVARAPEPDRNGGGNVPDALRRAVAAAAAAGEDWPDRETAENALGRALAAVDRAALPVAVVAELEEAEQALVLARLVHNDAVRDTLGLRSRRLVRWLHLAGNAPLPRYFEIADPRPGVTTTARIGPNETGASSPI